MRISRLSLRHVGPFDDAMLSFPEPPGAGELILFEGPNGSGKTTLAEAIAVLVGHARGPGLEQGVVTAAVAPWQVFNSRIRDEGEVSATFTHGDSALSVSHHTSMKVSAIRSTNPIIDLLDNFNLAAVSPAGAAERLRWAAFAFHAHMPDADLTTPGPREITEHPLKGALGFSRGYRASASLGQFLVNLEFERVQSAQYAAERPGEATRFQASAEERKRMLQRLEHAFSELVGRTVTLAFQPGKLAPKLLFDGEDIPIALLGEGMRGTVSWLSDLLVRIESIHWADMDRSPFEQEFWLILDEIEASLHPTMQMRVLPALRTLFPRARIYATTHSPFVVASAGEGYVFSIQPDPVDHRVRGEIHPTRLEPGQSLEWVVEAIFGTPTGIIDHPTRAGIEAHQRDVELLRRGAEIDWTQFLARRRDLVSLNDEVSTIVRMTEAPVRKEVDAELQGGRR